jgi:hypothetical protein
MTPEERKRWDEYRMRCIEFTDAAIAQQDPRMRTSGRKDPAVVKHLAGVDQRPVDPNTGKRIEP